MCLTKNWCSFPELLIIILKLILSYHAQPTNLLGSAQLNAEVPSHKLGQIADLIKEWEGMISDKFKLDECDVEAIKIQHPGKLKLQS